MELKKITDFLVSSMFFMTLHYLFKRLIGQRSEKKKRDTGLRI